MTFLASTHVRRDALDYEFGWTLLDLPELERSSFFSLLHYVYRISSYSFRGNYSLLNLEIQSSQYIRPKVTVHKGAETIQGRKLFKGGNYIRKYGI